MSRGWLFLGLNLLLLGFILFFKVVPAWAQSEKVSEMALRGITGEVVDEAIVKKLESEKEKKTVKKKKREKSKKEKLKNLKIDINKATLKEWTQIPGIGKKMAARIVEYRKKIGGFKKFSDLLGVRGIGKKKLLKWKDYLLLDGKGMGKLAEEKSSKKIKKQKSKKSTDSVKDNKTNKISKVSKNDDGKIELNTATKEELMKLPRVGEKMAERIIEYRTKHKFETIEDLMKVKGIGKATFSKLKDKIYIKK